MPSKQNPGVFDCYKAAMIDEPIFVILGRDPAGPATLRFWIEERGRLGKVKTAEDLNRLKAADQEAVEMGQWRYDNLDWNGEGQPLWKADRITSEGNPVCLTPEEAQQAEARDKTISGLSQIIKAAQKVHDIRADLENFDGDRRGIYSAKEEAVEDLLAIVLRLFPDKGPITGEYVDPETNTIRTTALPPPAPDKPVAEDLDNTYYRITEEMSVSAAVLVESYRQNLDRAKAGKEPPAEDLAHSPEMPDHRFAVFQKGEEYAYARGLEVSPTHLATVLDRMAADGWHVVTAFGQTDSQHIGFLFRRERPASRLFDQIAESPPEPAGLPREIDADVEIHIEAHDPEQARLTALTLKNYLSPIRFGARTRITCLRDGVSEPAFVLDCENGCKPWDRGEGLRP